MLNHQKAKQIKVQIDADKLDARRTYGNTSPVSFSEYASSWLAANPGSANKVMTYPGVLKNYLEPVLGRRKLADVAGDREGVVALLTSLTPGVERERVAYSCPSAISRPPSRVVGSARLPRAA